MIFFLWRVYKKNVVWYNWAFVIALLAPLRHVYGTGCNDKLHLLQQNLSLITIVQKTGCIVKSDDDGICLSVALASVLKKVGWSRAGWAGWAGAAWRAALGATSRTARPTTTSRWRCRRRTARRGTTRRTHGDSRATVLGRARCMPDVCMLLWDSSTDTFVYVSSVVSDLIASVKSRLQMCHSKCSYETTMRG